MEESLFQLTMELKNLYVASTGEDGHMVTCDLANDQIFTRTKMRNYSGGFVQDNYLWSPTGQKL